MKNITPFKTALFQMVLMIIATISGFPSILSIKNPRILIWTLTKSI